MRFHRNYEQLQLWRDAQVMRDFARCENLVAARFEPVIRQGLAYSTLDLTFRAQGHYLIVPAIIVDSPQLVMREQDRFVWPANFAEALDDSRAFEIEERLFPWLRSLSLAHSLTTERVRHFGTQEERELFEAARVARFVGAARYEDSVLALAPYVYAARYAYGKNACVIAANDGVQGAVYLSRVAKSVTVSQGDVGEVQLGAQWFGPAPAQNEFAQIEVAIYGADAETVEAERLASNAVSVRIDHESRNAAERRIAAVAYPMDILFTWETLHAPAAREFAVMVPQVLAPHRAAAIESHRVVGGSGGRVLIGLRKDWETALDGDVDSALRLVELLRSEGFTVDITGDPATCDFSSYDVAHWFNVVEAPLAAAFLARARAAGVRTILTATFLDISGGKRQWGAETGQVAFMQECDETSIRAYLGFVARRALLAPSWDDENVRRGPFPGYDAMLSQTLGMCDVVIAECSGEADLINSLGYVGDLRIIPPFLPAGRGAERVRPPVGFERFALIHAPIEPRHNQLYAVRGAREASVPLVLAGFARDMEYAARVREAADDRVVMIDPSPPELEWLYGCAEVVADMAWYGFGTERLSRGILSGAGVCSSSSGWAPSMYSGLVTECDPAVPGSLAQALKSAVPVPESKRVELAGGLNSTALLRNVLAAYLGAPATPAHA